MSPFQIRTSTKIASSPNEAVMKSRVGTWITFCSMLNVDIDKCLMRLVGNTDNLNRK